MFLDVFEAVRAWNDPALTQQLKDHLATLPDPSLAPFAGTLHGGNPLKGKDLFNNHLAAQCVRCHAVGPGGSGVGPNLVGIGTKDPAYLLAALVQPGRDIAPGFGFTTVTFTDATTLSGLLEKESSEQVSVRLASGYLREIARSKIETISPPVSSMPPMGGILTQKELRDVLAYLQSLK